MFHVMIGEGAKSGHFKVAPCLFIDNKQWHRCQRQRTKKRDRADEKAGFSTFHTARGATGRPTAVHLVDATWILPEL